jgi:proline dehydrogenase
MQARSTLMTNISTRLGTLLSAIVAPFAKRFVAGTTLPDALKAVERIEGMGFHTTLDYLGESVTSREKALEATEKYTLILKALKERGLETFVSIKLTQLGLDIDREFCLQNLSRIVGVAEEMKGFVRVDMEGSGETQATLDAIRAVRTNRSIPLGAVLQAMLTRTPEDMVDLMQREIPIRLCKGAYKEPADIALQDTSEIQQQFLSLAKRLLVSGHYHAIATHDPWLIDRIKAFAQKQGIEPSRFEFQMLLGIRRRLQRRIKDEGYTVRIYVPFGHAWLPYMWRRLRERKENMVFFVKHLFVR